MSAGVRAARARTGIEVRAGMATLATISTREASFAPFVLQPVADFSMSFILRQNLNIL